MQNCDVWIKRAWLVVLAIMSFALVGIGVLVVYNGIPWFGVIPLFLMAPLLWYIVIAGWKSVPPGADG